MDGSADSIVYDLAVIGGGVNGCGIARDAAGRGLSVFLCERRDLGSGTSSASTKLVHGGLRYLEHYEFRLVREALREREVLWSLAPHIIWPMRFVLPYHSELRPAWMLRLGLFLYDHLGGRRRLPPTRTIRFDRDRTGAPLKPEFKLGFEYSDCWVEDSRLVVLNAMAAAELGATVRPRTACVSAEREGDVWRLGLRDETSGALRTVRARVLINAAGPWLGEVAASIVRNNERAPVRLVQGSHIVVPRLYDHDESYIFQNADNRIFFVIPYETDFSLIGTTDRDYEGDPAKAAASPEEIAYLCDAASAYLRRPITPDMVVWTYSGVRPLHDEGGGRAQEATRDYVLELDAPTGSAPLLSIYGGKITTYRKLAEAALRELAPFLPPGGRRSPGWTAHEALPGGDFPMEGFAAEVERVIARHPFLGATRARRLVRAYGTRVADLLGDARSEADLGTHYGAGLTEAELRYLARAEWARTADDVLWRRSKLGLRLTAEQKEAVEEAMGWIASSVPLAKETA